MRLLNVQTFKLHTFYGDNIPPYAILSHTWLEDEREVTFAEMQSLESNGGRLALANRHYTTNKRSSWSLKPGMMKIWFLCDRAAKDGYTYAWIDTCCIDKSNSTELSEAINSMFDWYYNSGVCYAYLMDINHALETTFLTSRWWTRAWTLQELLASTKVEFFDSQWRYIGSKIKWAAEISLSTGIDEETLHVPQRMFFKSVAQRMSWAAGREAKRLEDRAYSLLGIFEISMSMQYGEGARAFMRLQEEILKGNNDQTLFAWKFMPKTIPEILFESHGWQTNVNNLTEFISDNTENATNPIPEILKDTHEWLTDVEHSERDISDYLDDDDSLDLSYTGMFANSPEKFQNCGQVTFHHRYALQTHIAELNGAWRMEMPLIPVKTSRDIYRIGLLPCGYRDRPHHLLAILLRSWTTGNRFERASPGHEVFTFLVDFKATSSAQTEQLWVDNRWWVARYQDPARGQGYLSRSIQVQINVNPEAYTFSSALPKDGCWKKKDSVLQLHNRQDLSVDHVLISFRYTTGRYINFALELPTSPDTQPIDPEDEYIDRIIVFAGREGDQDWDRRIERIFKADLSDARSNTPDWSIIASIKTRRVFNQLISTLEINEVDGLEDKHRFVGAIGYLGLDNVETEHLLQERRALLEAVKGPRSLWHHELDLQMGDIFASFDPSTKEGGVSVSSLFQSESKELPVRPRDKALGRISERNG